MSNPNATVGSVFKGLAKGKIKYSGSNIVNADKNVNVGGSFEGTQEEQSEINFAEINQLNTNTNQNTDQNPESTDPTTSKVEDYKVESNETPHIGSKVYNNYKNKPNIFTGDGAVVTVKNISGNVRTRLTYHENVSGRSRDIGDVTLAQNIGDDVSFDSDIKVSMYLDQKMHHMDFDEEGIDHLRKNIIRKRANGDITITKDVMEDLLFRINGHMTIFNQEFKNSTYFRVGSINDVEYLTTTFRRFDIVPSVKLDLNYKDIVNEITALSKTDFSKYKLFVCVYMSHGHKNGYVSAADEEFNLRKTIIDPIMKNKSLNGIPKIFIAVACRGDDNYEENDNEEFDGHIVSTVNGIDYSNLIISYSTYEGHVSKRTRNGTYFVQSLCDNINENKGETKIHSHFAKVNAKLAEMYKQVPVFESSMGDISLKDLASTSN